MRSCNDAGVIGETLKMVYSQTIKDFELINIDNASTDGTFEIIKKYNRSGKIITIGAGEYVPGKVLNDAVAIAKGEIIVFLNADATPVDEKWLEFLIKGLDEKEVVAVYGRQIARNDANLLVRLDYRRAYPSKGEKSKLSEQMFSFASAAFCKKIWKQYRIYEEGYSEDLEWCHRLMNNGHKCKYITQSLVYHSHNFALRQLFKKRYRHGIALLCYHDDRLQKVIFFTLLKRCAVNIFRDIICGLQEFNSKMLFYSPVYRITIFLGYCCGLIKGMRLRRRAK